MSIAYLNRTICNIKFLHTVSVTFVIPNKQELNHFCFWYELIGLKNCFTWKFWNIL